MQARLSPVEYEFLQRRVVRRLQRVKDRMATSDDPDEILDDFFVLWRAFESTADLVDMGVELQQLPPNRSLIDRISKSVDVTIRHRRGIACIRRLRHFAIEFPKLVSQVDGDALERWFR